MKTTTIAIICTILIVELFSLLFAWNSRGFDAGTFGVATVLLMFVFFIIGLIMSLIKNTRDVGKGILIASGILLLIGVSVCSSL
jgi:cell division protein FtsW (lipid II flippase)